MGVSENWVYDQNDDLSINLWVFGVLYSQTNPNTIGYAQLVLYLIQLLLNWADRPLTSLAQMTYFNPTVVKHHSYPAVIQPGKLRTFEPR